MSIQTLVALCSSSQCRTVFQDDQQSDMKVTAHYMPKIGNRNSVYEGWNFNSGNYLFTTDTK